MIFGSSAFRRGMYDLKVWPDVQADGELETKTPGKIRADNKAMPETARLNKVSLPLPDVCSNVAFRYLTVLFALQLSICHLSSAAFDLFISCLNGTATVTCHPATG